MKDLEQIIVSINYESIEQTSEKILAKVLEMHFKTVFVGAVFQIEREFGFLWGECEDFDESKLTDEQKVMYEKFLSIREKIFNQGNRERKNAVQKLKAFDIRIKDK
jgi:hypothetical protein